MINQWCWEDWVTFNLLLSSLWLIIQGWNTLTARIQSMLLLEIAKEITAVCPEVYNSLQYNYNNSHEFLNKVEWLFPFLEVQHRGYLSLLHFEYWIANKGKCSAFNFLFFFPYKASTDTTFVWNFTGAGCWSGHGSLMYLLTKSVFLPYAIKAVSAKQNRTNSIKAFQPTCICSLGN